jgi:hypothetical protein
VFAELLDRRTGQVRHEHLQAAADPLRAIRHSLHCFPFACLADRDVLDSGISGYGFQPLLQAASCNPLAIVLNDPPVLGLRGRVSGVLCAAIAASPSVSRLYLQRHAACAQAVRLAQQSQRVLLVTPAKPVRRDARGFVAAHAEGLRAASRILAFAADAVA